MIFTHDDVKQFLNSLTDDDLLALRSRFKEILSPLPANTYTVDDLATSLHFSRDTIINRIRKGDFGDVIRDGRRYRVTEKGLQQYISKYNSLAFSKKQPTQRHRAHTNPGRI